MIETLWALWKMTIRMTFGLRYSPNELRSLLKTLKRDYEIFGKSSRENAFISSLSLDEARHLQKKMLRKTIKHAYEHVAFYQKTINPKILKDFDFTNMEHLPITYKKDLKDDPWSFLSDDVKSLVLLGTTSGTTATPMELYFSRYEIETWALLQAITALYTQMYLPDDIIQYNIPLTVQPDTNSTVRIAREIGALAIMQGIINPEKAVESLVKDREMKGKKRKVNVLMSYPSYLMKIMKVAQRMGYKPDDFDVERVYYYGEVMAEKQKELIQDFFKATIYSAYGSTEMIPMVGFMCRKGNFHFEALSGLVEFLDPRTKQPIDGDKKGVLVATPFYPYKETMPTIRYWTGDMAKKVKECGCGTTEHGGVYRILGRQRYNLWHNDEVLTQKEFMDTLCSVEGVSQPLRYNVTMTENQLNIDVQVQNDNPSLKHEIADVFREMIDFDKVVVRLHKDGNFTHVPLRSENEAQIRRGETETPLFSV